MKYLWCTLALPYALAGLLLCLAWYRAHSWRFQGGRLECIAGRRKDGRTRIFGKKGAHDFGFLACYASQAYRKYRLIKGD